jgi:hypothetical protein
MRALIGIVQKMIGLFIDDGSLAAVILAWIVACGVVPLSASVIPARWSGVIFFLGLALILIENVHRATRRCRLNLPR